MPALDRSMEQEIEQLRAVIAEKDAELDILKQKLKCNEGDSLPMTYTSHKEVPSYPLPSDTLNNHSILRYGRQLILPEIGVKGQLLLSKTSVLVVGAGGLGCPAAIYLAAAGIGCIGLVDYDAVDIGNLHRQILHTESRVGKSKAASATRSCNKLNSSVRCVPYNISLNSHNALDLIKEYDIILDATDNVATRYLLNDASVLAGKPLVSGSALRFEGQLTVYNYAGGPCYRCLFPQPPPADTVTNCSDGGVLGVVPGIIGCLQALEVIKLAAGIGSSYAQRLLLFDALDGSFRTIKLRPKQKTCCVCGDQPTVTELIDYEQFCGSRATDKTKHMNVLEETDRISVKEYSFICGQEEPHVLIDVRPSVETEICVLSNATNIPISELKSDAKISLLRKSIQEIQLPGNVPVYVVCRHGNDSQKAVLQLKERLRDLPVVVKDIVGGLTAWTQQIDPNFPAY